MNLESRLFAALLCVACAHCSDDVTVTRGPRDASSPDSASHDGMAPPEADASQRDASADAVVEEGGTPRIVYFNYLPEGDEQVAPRLRLRAERRPDGRIALVDEAADVDAEHAHYAINGAVVRSDSRRLSTLPVPANRWIHFVKFYADVDNINSDGWRTVHRFTGGNGLRASQNLSVLLYVADGTTPPALPHTEPLWREGTVRDGLIFDASPGFTVPSRIKYGSEVDPLDEPTRNLDRVGWYRGADRFELLYAAAVAQMIADLGARAPDGITSFDAAGLARAADWLASHSRAHTFAVDFEPADPARESWMWNYDDPRFTRVMRELSALMWTRHRRRFYAFLAPDTSLEHHGKRLSLNGGGWWSAAPSQNIEDFRRLHEDPSSVTNVERSSDKVVQFMVGYGSTVVNTGDSTSDAAGSWRSPMTWYLRSLDVLNVQSLIATDEEFLLFLWPFQDSFDVHSPMQRFRLPGFEGMMRMQINRVAYPPNLVRDLVVTFLANPRTTYVNYWRFGQTYDPMGSMAWATVNGAPRCNSVSGGFHVFEYTGAGDPPCPANGREYMGTEIVPVSAMVQGLEIFSRHLAPTLDGTQRRVHLDRAFTFARDGEPERPASWRADTGEFVRAFSDRQPWVQLWRNPSSGRTVLLFQDNFADAFERVTFTVHIGGRAVQRQAVGNQLYFEVLDR